MDLPIEVSKVKANISYFETTEDQKRDIWSNWLIGNNGDDKKFINFDSIEFMSYLERVFHLGFCAFLTHFRAFLLL